MASSQSNSEAGVGDGVLLAKLTSTVISEINEAKDEIHQLLMTDSCDSHTVLGDLFNLYVSSDCLAAAQILLDQSQQRHVMFLLDKMNDSFKEPDKRYQTMMLLWSIIQRQPSWLHTIISTAFFHSFIKCLKEDPCKDVVIVMTGILIITALLPSVPSLVSSVLDDFYKIFEKVFLLTTRKGVVPETHLLHLQFGIHVFFHHLYAMYPNSTITCMKNLYDAHHGNDVVKAIELLLRWQKLHPWLITETEQTEISNSKWRSKEPHDVIIDCEKLSLDPCDLHLQENEMLSLVSPSRQSFSEVQTNLESSGILTSSDNSVQQATHEEEQRLDIATQTGTSLQNYSSEPRTSSFDSGTSQNVATPLVTSSIMVCSPTMLCSLMTPPQSQDASPTGSSLDVSIGHNQCNISSSLGNMSLADLTPTRFEHDAEASSTMYTRNITPHAGAGGYAGRDTPPPVGSHSKNDGKSHEKDKDNLTSTISDNVETKPSETVEDDSKGKQRFPENLGLMSSFLPCTRCLESRATNKGISDWENQQAPAQLLDQYLKCGKSLQGRKLNRIPLTSQIGTEWTHFGGKPPADEITLLQNELLLLQSEVLFERHKCDLHATRNRRLVGKVFETNALKEDLVATREKMKCLEREVSSLEEGFMDKIAENRALKEKAGSWDSEQLRIISELLRTNEKLVVEKEEVDGGLKQFRSENQKLQVELKEANARVSQLENKMFHLKSVESESDYLKSQSDMQAKSLVMMGEREEMLKDAILRLRKTVRKCPEDGTKLLTYEKEHQVLQGIVCDLTSELNFSKTQLSEMESSVTQKEHHVRDLKKTLENVKKVWKDKLEVVESKYQTIKRANQRLESEVMSLQSKLDARSKDSGN